MDNYGDSLGGGDSGHTETPVAVPEAPANIIALMRARSRYACLTEERRRALEAWESEHATTLTAWKESAGAVANLEELVRKEALEAWAITGNTTAYPGTEVKYYTRYEYDPKQALHWAIRHELALHLDKEAYEAILKSMPSIPEGVKRVDEPKATIATDLAKALEIT